MLTFRSSTESFFVDEIPAYAPSGGGDHTFARIEKRNLTTFDAIARLASAFGIDGRDIGYAGLKDKHAVTRQWLSLPRISPEQLLTFSHPDLVVLEAARHGHKLRLGHLRGNRFEIALTGEASPDEIAALEARFAAMVAAGIPNVFGGQRFGAAGDNARTGLEILRGERKERDRRRRRLLLSALQSAVFNRYLVLRARGGPLQEVRPGDVLRKNDTGGLFITEDLAADQARVDAGLILPTGPLPGGREVEPPPGTPARALEDQAIEEVGATRQQFLDAGRELPGARRPVLLRLDPSARAVAEEGASSAGGRVLRVSFSLPPGGYATVVVDALLAGGSAASD